jgi:hypothetical protein
MTDSLIVKDQVDDNTDYYSLLVGENAKFKNEKDLAKGKYIADQYVQTLESQMDSLRKDYLKEKEQNVARAKLEDLLDRLEKRQTESPNAQPTVVEQTKTPSIKKEEIDSLIDTRIQERETTRKQTENFNFVKQKLTEKYGSNYTNHLANLMAELDVSEDYLNQTARTNPKLILKTLGVDDVSPNRDPYKTTPKSAVNSTNFKPNVEVRNWDYYMKMKETNPKQYYSPATNVQMHKDAIALGDAFETDHFNKYEKDYRIKY